MDGGFFLSSISTSNDGDVIGNHGSFDIWLLKIDSIGNIKWQKCIGGSSIDELYSSEITKDGGFIISGYSISTDGDLEGYSNLKDHDAWIVKLDSIGAIEWMKFFRGTHDEYGTKISQTRDGGFVFSCETFSNDGEFQSNFIPSNIWLAKSDNKGEIIWSKVLGGNGTDSPENIISTSDSGIVLIGATSSKDGDLINNHGSMDIWIIKLKECNEYSFDFVDFSNTNLIKLNGRAKENGRILRLCPSISNEVGSVFFKEPISVTNKFTCNFSFSFSQGKNDYEDGSPEGADGLAFVIQGLDIWRLGSSGGGIGYSGIPNSLAIEFDTYNNGEDYGEYNGSHLSVFSNGEGINTSNHKSTALLEYTEDIPLLKADSTIYYGKIEYVYSAKSLKIWINTQESFTEPVLEIDSLNFLSLLKLIDNEKAFIGFTASTGTSRQNTDLITWNLCDIYEPNYTSLKEIKYIIQENMLYISPNPATDYIDINVGAQRAVSVDVSIFNILGEYVIKVEQTSSSVQKINVSHLSPGLYFVRVGDVVRKFVKL